MSAVRGAWDWVERWQISLLFAAITLVFVFGLWSASNQRHAAWEADIRFCHSSNERTVVLRDFVLAASVDPDPRQFDFIADPKLRAGVIEQARKGRADQRDRANRTFTTRNCEAEYPEP
jgi:hypothetical protein